MTMGGVVRKSVPLGAVVCFTVLLGSAAAIAAPGAGQAQSGLGGTTASGESYGVAGSSVADSHDFVAVLADNGEFGYVRADQYYGGPEPATPAEAIAEQRAATNRQLPVFATDGKTVIGTFTIASSNQSFPPPPDVAD